MFKSFKNLSKFELRLWLASLAVILISALLGGRENLPSALCSIVGVTALIFVAKGDVLGQVLTIVFALGYGAISLTFAYYGEMITYVFMSAPMALLAVIAWLRHPYKPDESEAQAKVGEVAVGHVGAREAVLMFVAAAAVTGAFYFILKALDTANLGFSTLSVTTSFLASYLTFRRSPYYALAYAANDLVLIVLWVLAATTDVRYLSMVCCFVMFFANDLYGFYSWQKMKKRQGQNA